MQVWPPPAGMSKLVATFPVVSRPGVRSPLMTLVESRRPRLQAADAAGWASVLTIAAATAATWWNLLFLPLGDSHDGRIMGRFGLHVRNFWELGLFGSGLVTETAPYGPAYAHHPPLTNAGQVLVSVLVGEGEWQLRLIGFVSGILTVVALAWLLRTLNLGWFATVGAIAATAATPMFWLYARLGVGFWIPVLLVTLAIRVRRHAASARPLMAAGVACALVSWEALAVAAVTAVWLIRTSHTRAAGRALAASIGLGLFVTIGWMLSATNVAELVQHTSDRVAAAGIGLGDYLRQQWWFYSTLFPRWYLVAVVPGLVAAWLAGGDRRMVAVLFTAIGVAFAVALPEASFIHDYWTKVLLVPFTVGLASVLDLIRVEAVRLAIAALAVVLFAGWVAGEERAWFEQAYFEDASDAGRLLQAVEPPAGQQTAWVIGSIALPRWMSWYWDLPVETLELDGLGETAPGDLVLARRDGLPGWVPDLGSARAAGEVGRYILIEARYLGHDPASG